MTIIGKPATAATTGPAPLAAPASSPAPTSPAPTSPGRLIVAGLLLPAAAIAVAAATLWRHEPGGITAVAAVSGALVIIWALVAMATARSRERTPQWQLAAGTLTAAVAAAAGRISAGTASAGGVSARPAAGGHHHLAVIIADIAGPALIAVSVHLELALPDGRLSTSARRAAAITGYAAAAVTAAALAGTATRVSGWAAVLAWSPPRSPRPASPRPASGSPTGPTGRHPTRCCAPSAAG